MSRVALVPLDGSELGEAALPSAAYLAREHDLTLVLFRVVPFPLVFAGDPMTGYTATSLYEEIIPYEREAAESYLSTVKQRLTDQGLRVETLLREGQPADQILDLADDVGARFIALATHGRGGLLRLAIGSVAERVLQGAAVPVLLVRIQDEAPARMPAFKRILVPLDRSPLAERALDAVQELADPDAELLLMTAQQRHTVTVPVGVTAVTVPDVDALDREVRETKAYLHAIASRLDADGRASQVLVRLGDPADEILQAARDHDVDAIMMSTHGHTGPARWLLGSVADRVVRDSRRPVILISTRALAARAAGGFTVGDVMTHDLTTARDDDSLMVAIRKLLRQGISGAPVVNAAGDLVGVLSEYNVLDWQRELAKLPPDRRPLSPDQYAWQLANARVRDVMTQPPPAVEESAVLSAAIDLFQERRARPLPVTRHGKLVGVIRRADVLKAMVSHWQPNEPAAETPPGGNRGDADADR